MWKDVRDVFSIEKNLPSLFEEILSGFVSLLQTIHFLLLLLAQGRCGDFRQSSNPGERPPLKHLRTPVTPGLLLDLFLAPAKEEKNNPPLILQVVVLQNKPVRIPCLFCFLGICQRSHWRSYRNLEQEIKGTCFQLKRLMLPEATYLPQIAPSYKSLVEK